MRGKVIGANRRLGNQRQRALGTHQQAGQIESAVAYHVRNVVTAPIHSSARLMAANHLVVALQ